ncbi:MAG TPA: RdgB/HAM1 family non-canonical purine NTP pyrophosphatase [Candidatus Angelobacter sp.]|nr:RdgB/HAM1 family non-canonical purine NTP pyrophosphatase [Candidatus Angelobacter sp.]
MPTLYLATTNPGKLREFREAAQNLALDLELFPRLKDIKPPLEDGATFEANARIKAEYYSRLLPGELVLAEDSGLSVDELGGAPGVYSARYAAVLKDGTATHTNSDDQQNNLALITELERLPNGNHAGKYVCVIALARDGQVLKTFAGEAQGMILTEPRGTGGFGYDPLFYFPRLGKTFAELPLDQKRANSHRGHAIRAFLEWFAKARV